MQGNDNAEPRRLLIASLESDSSLYAVERVKSEVYALCKLCNWVKIGYLDNSSSVSYMPTGPLRADCHDMSTGEWWKRAAVNEDPGLLRKPANRPRVSMAPSTPVVKVMQPGPAPAASKINLPPPNPMIHVPETQPTSQHVFETLVDQYLEALYKSKTSLAFFAKGPLSRARAACTLDAQEDLSTSRLVTFLRTMLLTMGSMDKKYREKLPGMIKSFPPGTLSDLEDEAPASVKKRKSKRPPKMSREGTYTFEEEYVKRWWFIENSTRQDETREQSIKRKISDLRVRETLVQVVLILEILALEATPEFKAAEAAGKDNDQQDTQNQMDPESRKKRKSKKPTDLIILLDLLMDKLSIWQSIENDGGNGDTQQINDVSLRNNDGKLHDRDLLASFCVEVVIPLYGTNILSLRAKTNIWIVTNPEYLNKQLWSTRNLAALALYRQKNIGKQIPGNLASQIQSKNPKRDIASHYKRRRQSHTANSKPVLHH